MKKFFVSTLTSQDAGGNWEKGEAAIPNETKGLSEGWSGFRAERRLGDEQKAQRKDFQGSGKMTGESGNNLTSLRFFPWGMDSRVEDEGRKLALIVAEPLNPREILTICANAKSIRPTALLPLNSRKSP